MGLGGWKGQEFESDALPLHVVTADPDPKAEFGWLYAKIDNGVATPFWRDDQGNVAPLGGVSQGFQIISSDPSSPTDGEVWYNSTDKRYRAHHTDNFNFAFSTDKNAAEYPGANLGAKVIAAIAAANNGDVIDAQGILTNQTIANTVVINKQVRVKWPAGTIVGTVSPMVDISFGTTGGGVVDAGGNGCIQQGVAETATIFQPLTGGVGFRVEGHDVSLRDFQVKFAGANAANWGIKFDPQDPAGPYILRPYVTNVSVVGSGRTGKGITFQKCYVGSMHNIHVENLDHGIEFIDDGLFVSSNAVQIGHFRAYNCAKGVYYGNFGTNWLHDGTIEGCDYGVYIDGSGSMFAMNNVYIEQIPGFGGINNIFIKGVNDGFSHTYDFVNVFWSGLSGSIPGQEARDIVLGAGTNQFVRVKGGEMNSGVNIGAGQPAAFIDCPHFGSDVGRVIRWTTTDNVEDRKGDPNVLLQIRNYLRVDLDEKTAVTANSTETAAQPSSGFDSAMTFNPSGASAIFGLAGRFNVLTDPACAQNFTNALIGLQAAFTHQGSGTLAEGAGVTISMANTGSGVVTLGAGILINQPSNTGTGHYDNIVQLQIARPTVGAISNSAIRVDGGLIVFNDTGSANGSLQVKGQADSNLFWVQGDSAVNAVGIGYVPVAGSSRLTVYRGTTETSGTRVSCEVDNISTPAGASSAAIYGSYITVGVGNGNGQTHGTLTGLAIDMLHQGTAAVTTMRGSNISVQVLNTGNLTNAIVQNVVFAQTAAATTSFGYGTFYNAPTVSAGTLSNWYASYYVYPGLPNVSYSIFVAGGRTYYGSDSPSGLTLSTEYVQEKHDYYGTYTWATGALATQRFTLFSAPTIAFVGNSTVSNAATVAIAGAPIAGAHATITNPLALWVQSGVVEFDGALIVTNGAANPATTGTIRLPKDSTITFRNASNSADVDVITYTNDDVYITAGGAGSSNFAIFQSLDSILNVDGTPTLPAYSFLGDTNTGMRTSAADHLTWVTGGLDRWEIDNNGHLVSPSNGSYTIGLSGGSKPKGIYLDSIFSHGNNGTPVVGFFGTSPAAKGGTFTQTYATTSLTHIEGSHDLVNGTGVSAVDQTMEDVTTSTLADPVKVNRNFAEIVAEYNLLRASVLSSKQVLNQLLDIIQAFGLCG